MTEIEYCEGCLRKGCEKHLWFGRPTTEQDILVLTLKRVLDILPLIIEKVYLVETVLYEPKDRFFTDGKIDFYITGIAAHKKKDYYIPVESYNTTEKDVIEFNINIQILIIRHNPMILNIFKGFLVKNLIHSVVLIRDNDFLHCEEIKDYNKIVRVADRRLQEFIDTIEGVHA